MKIQDKINEIQQSMSKVDHNDFSDDENIDMTDPSNFKGHTSKIQSKSQVSKIQNRYEAYIDDDSGSNQNDDIFEDEKSGNDTPIEDDEGDDESQGNQSGPQEIVEGQNQKGVVKGRKSMVQKIKTVRKHYDEQRAQMKEDDYVQIDVLHSTIERLQEKVFEMATQMQRQAEQLELKNDQKNDKTVSHLKASSVFNNL